ncbi:hypothetical protein AiwAL_14140 [Acidiphilium sp. AL]|uniref:Uncharacterized protein n=1 Tax=Acidiphilium iwatense TaxID=768198 RepID=A0ABS9E0F3_9PROT|nr:MULTISPECIES: hypothetical protein [Acidiphilium]MCF3948501.1 hypothetical protein [Acidiphilium iwatense]MCU4161232.1 hypothetical protein [Acidiphilium sp. AL]
MKNIDNDKEKKIKSNEKFGVKRTYSSGLFLAFSFVFLLLGFWLLLFNFGLTFHRPAGFRVSLEFAFLVILFPVATVVFLVPLKYGNLHFFTLQIFVVFVNVFSEKYFVNFGENRNTVNRILFDVINIFVCISFVIFCLYLFWCLHHKKPFTP